MRLAHLVEARRANSPAPTWSAIFTKAYALVAALTGYRNAARLSRVPWPLRRALWWAGLNVLGRLRCHHFGTFGVTSVGALGAGLLHIVPLLTSTLHYGMFDASGVVAMRLSFDHRVLEAPRRRSRWPTWRRPWARRSSRSAAVRRPRLERLSTDAVGAFRVELSSDVGDPDTPLEKDV
jgi:hypothetical protein